MPSDPAEPKPIPTQQVRLRRAAQMKVVALGGELKNTVCALRGKEAVILGPHGDLRDAAAFHEFVASVERARAGVGSDALVIAHDLHPLYLSSVHATQMQNRKVAVQHHFAHAVCCAVDAGVELPVIGVVCDGTGYGTDGAIWGGEVLLCRTDSFQRLAHLAYFPVPSGDAAARTPWRPALGLLREAFAGQTLPRRLACFERVDPQELRLVSRQLEAGLNVSRTSSLGRLFDAISFLAGICSLNTYEGQAAIELEKAATDQAVKPYSYELSSPVESEGEALGPVELEWRPMIREIVADAESGAPARVIGSRFHATVAAMFADAVVWAAGRTAIQQVVLSGGCFFNRLFREGMIRNLTARGMAVATHRTVSPGDAGLSLGQAVIASAVADNQP